MKDIILTLSLAVLTQLAFATTNNEGESTSPQAGAESLQQQELTLQDKKEQVSAIIEVNKEKIGEKKAVKLEKLLNKKLEKAEERSTKINPKKVEKKRNKFKRMFEKRDADTTKVDQKKLRLFITLGLIALLVGIILIILPLIFSIPELVSILGSAIVIGSFGLMLYPLFEGM